MKYTKQVSSVDINPFCRLLWIGRLPKGSLKNYTGGERFRQYRWSVRRALRVALACQRLNLNWSQDSNGTHFRRSR